jgi:hypothetical protein
MICWHSRSAKTRIQIEFTDPFDARGMRRVYGRGDCFGRGANFNMDIWRDQNGNLFTRFWSRSVRVEDVSLAIRGIFADSLPQRVEGAGFSDAWLPRALRDKYEEWVLEYL